MNRKYIGVSLLTLLLASCSNYLKEDSADLLIPTSVSDYAPVFRGEAYPDAFTTDADFANLMTDDVEMGPLYYNDEMKNNKRASLTWYEGADLNMRYGEGAYVWRNDYSEYLTDAFWAARYDNILGCNTIIEALPDMTYDAATETGIYRALAAQAYAMRAYQYFCLINTYALPYSEENLDKPGVILKLKPDIEIASKARATIGEVYAQINSDIKTAQEYMVGADFECEMLSNMKPELTSAAIYFLAARIALFQEDWDGVIAAGEKFLAKNATIFDLNSVDSTSMGFYHSHYDTSAERENIYVANHQQYDEVVWGFGGTSDYSYFAPSNYIGCYEYGFHPSWDGDNALINLYEEDDLRLLAYFERPYDKSGTTRYPVFYAGQYKPHKYDSQFSTNCCTEAWRSPEVYLDMAEAYARKSSGVSSEAIDYLNQLRVKKFKTGSANAEKQVSDFANKDALVKFIWEERRRELCFQELMRFWDMRRQGMPAQEHRWFTTVKNYSVYSLREGSPNYVLPIPTSETSYNSACVNNQRETIGVSSEGTLE